MPRAQRGLSALVDRAPQAEALGQRVRERLRPASTWLYTPGAAWPPREWACSRFGCFST